MDIVVQKSGYVDKLLGKQRYDKSENYRKIKYLKPVTVEDGLLVFNALTNEMVFLDKQEERSFEDIDINSEVVKRLIENWYIVPENNDDLKLSREFAEFNYAFSCARFGGPLNSFVILPTTDCNARCFYCFELAGNRRHMTEQTAHDTADFIEKKCNKAFPVNIRWFGGEPLYNSKVIDIICNDLNKKGITYTTSMVSNGYLFDEETVKKSKDLWKMTWVQITLDGTEEIYNRTKAYIYKNENAFVRVIRNIKLLLEAGIKVNVRMNMDDHNEQDLFKLSDYLINRFAKYKEFNLYSALLFEDSCARISARADDARHDLILKNLKLKGYIEKFIENSHTPLKAGIRINHCMADSDTCTMILPDGMLGRCQHFTDDNFYGSIYTDDIDYDVVNRFKQVDVIDPEKCDECELRPYCMCLTACKIVPRRCDKFDKEQHITYLEAKMKNSYINFKKENENNETQV